MLESVSKEENFPVRADKATSLSPSTIQAVMPVRLQFWFLQKTTNFNDKKGMLYWNKLILNVRTLE